MTEIALDPIGYSEALQKAGMPRAQADLIARTEDARMDGRLRKLARDQDLATRKDLAETELALRTDIDNLELGLRADIARVEKQMAEMEARLVKAFHNALFAFGGVLVAGIAAAAALVAALLK